MDWDAQPLGRTTDADLAHKLGMSPKTVCSQRLARGIPVFRPPSEIDWDTEPLG